MIELMASDQQLKFGQDKLDSLPRYCLECDVRFGCHGECPKNRFVIAPDGEPGLNYLCPGFKHFFHHVDYPMQIIADLVRRGRPAAEVMGILATEESKWSAVFAQTGRNDPCPCESGRKYKQCHGRPRSEQKKRPPLRPAPGPG